MRDLKGLVALLLLFVWLFVLPASSSMLLAQLEPVYTYTLGDAIAVALENNLGVRIAAFRTDVASRNNSPAFSGRYPTVDFNLSDNNRVQVIDNPASFINGTFQNIGVTGQVVLNWVLFDGFRVRLTEERLQQLQFLAEGSEAVVIQNTVQAVMQSYYSALLERERLKLLDEALRLSEERLQTESNRRDLGAGTTFEQEQARANLLNDRRDRRLQEQNYRQALLSLMQLLNLPPETSVALSDDLPLPAAPVDDENDDNKFNVGPYEWSALRDRLLTRNPDLRNEYINLEILKRDYELARSERLPSANLNAGTGYTESRIRLNESPVRAGSTIDYFANFTLSWRIYQGGFIRKSIENAEIQQMIGKLTIEQARLGLETQLRTAWEDYTARLEAFNLSEAAQQAQQKVLDIAEERLKQGTITALDFRNFQLQYVQTGFARMEALHRLALAEVTLLRLSGGMVR